MVRWSGGAAAESKLAARPTYQVWHEATASSVLHQLRHQTLVKVTIQADAHRVHEKVGACAGGPGLAIALEHSIATSTAARSVVEPDLLRRHGGQGGRDRGHPDVVPSSLPAASATTDDTSTVAGEGGSRWYEPPSKGETYEEQHSGGDSRPPQAAAVRGPRR